MGFHFTVEFGIQHRFKDFTEYRAGFQADGYQILAANGWLDVFQLIVNEKPGFSVVTVDNK